MKTQQMVTYSIIFFTLAFFGFSSALFALTNKTPGDLLSLLTQKSTVLADDGRCDNTKPTLSISQSTQPNIQKLAQAQIVCDAFVSNTLMVFTDMPKDIKGADVMATQMGNILKEFAKYNISPIVIIEPVTDWGYVDFTDFKNGFYDPWNKEYFKKLKALGITDTQMGMWVPFPEANLPYWNKANTTPSDFGILVNDYLGMVKSYFPHAQGSILLNSATYSNYDFSWTSGEYDSLVPYVSGIKPGLVDSFGYEGFPWMPDAQSQVKPITDASEFLVNRIAVDAASSLHVKKIWFNTGTFQTKYAQNNASIVFVDASTRQQILNSIISEVQKVKAKGFSVSINLFSQDKSAAAEATDWSYWKDPNDKGNLQQYAFKTFVTQAISDGIGISLFDQ